MDISINQQNQEYIKQKVASGEYASPDDVIDAALRLLDEHDRKLAALREEIQKGFDSGPSLPGKVVMEDLIRKAKQQLPQD